RIRTQLLSQWVEPRLVQAGTCLEEIPSIRGEIPQQDLRTRYFNGPFQQPIQALQRLQTMAPFICLQYPLRISRRVSFTQSIQASTKSVNQICRLCLQRRLRALARMEPFTFADS